MKKTTECKHDWKPIYEDHILMGVIYYGQECTKCKQLKDAGPGPLDLGVYTLR